MGNAQSDIDNAIIAWNARNWDRVYALCAPWLSYWIYNSNKPYQLIASIMVSLTYNHHPSSLPLKGRHAFVVGLLRQQQTYDSLTIQAVRLATTPLLFFTRAVASAIILWHPLLVVLTFIACSSPPRVAIAGDRFSVG
jgi:hypothetical protein